MDELKFKNKWIEKISIYYRVDIKEFDKISKRSKSPNISDHLYEFLQSAIHKRMIEFNIEMENEEDSDYKFNELQSINALNLYRRGEFLEDEAKVYAKENKIEDAIK